MGLVEMLIELENGLSLLAPADADFVVGIRFLLDTGETLPEGGAAKIRALYQQLEQLQLGG